MCEWERHNETRWTYQDNDLYGWTASLVRLPVRFLHVGMSSRRGANVGKSDMIEQL